MKHTAASFFIRTLAIAMTFNIFFVMRICTASRCSYFHSHSTPWKEGKRDAYRGSPFGGCHKPLLTHCYEIFPVLWISCCVQKIPVLHSGPVDLISYIRKPFFFLLTKALFLLPPPMLTWHFRATA